MENRSRTDLGWLVVGHGTRDPIGQGEFAEVVRELAARSVVSVAGAFLELAEPTIAQALADLAGRGVRRVIVVPLLLFTAGHAKEDVPGEVAQAAARLAMEVVGQSAALELHPRLLELSRLRFWEAMGGEQGNGKGETGEETLLLMVGRGGSDEGALAAMRRYTEALSSSLGVHGQTAFAALASPSVGEAIEEVARLGFGRVVVQPHLLFSGKVSQSINRQIVLARGAHPQLKWLISRHLGPHPLLLEAIFGRIEELGDKVSP